ncbi:hypothetical protein [Pantoea sp. FN0305]|uniref:hypothetical protein n=1 Tax=Pantoea sp. FN0305 TaxID=3418559 RepID=UPI003CF81526
MIPHVAAGISAPRGDLFGEDSTLSDAAMSQFSRGCNSAFWSANRQRDSANFVSHSLRIIALYAKVL